MDDIEISPSHDKNRGPLRLAAVASAVALVAGTLLRHGLGGNAFLWAVVQLVLVSIAVVDVETRRVPNSITGVSAVGAIVLRAGFVPHVLPGSLLAGAVAFGAFLALAIVARGGFGMGDVKLAGLLGLLLGRASIDALFLGVLAGGIASLTIYVRSRSRRTTLAYAPYLCLGAALSILVTSPPPLV